MKEFGFTGISNVFYDSESVGYPMERELRKKYTDSVWIMSEKKDVFQSYDVSSNFFTVNPRELYLTVNCGSRLIKGKNDSDFFVPFTSFIGNDLCPNVKRLYICVNREEVMINLFSEVSKHRDSRFEIGKYSDLVAEDRITKNLVWVINEFAKGEMGQITFATSFVPTSDIYTANHKMRTFIRMNVNPGNIIKAKEPLSSPLGARIHALNKLSYAGYPCGVIVAPVCICDGWEHLYSELFDFLEAVLCEKIKNTGTVEIVFDRNSFDHKEIKLKVAEFIAKQSLKKLPLMKITDIR